MTRIVTNDYRYKRPKPKRKPVALKVPAVVSRGSKRSRVSNRLDTSDEAKTAPATASEDPKPTITISISRKRARLRHAAQRSADDDERKPAIVTAPLMETPLSRESVEREGDDYKRLKAAMARRLRGE